MANPNDLTSQEIGTLGFFISLISLLGTFFYVQLSNWLRDLLASEALYDANKVGSKPEEKEELRKLKYSIVGLYNSVPLVTSIAISTFIALVAGIIIRILSPSLSNDYLAKNLMLALCSFLAIYALLTGYLLLRGYSIGRKIYDGTRSKERGATKAEPQPTAD